MSWHHEIRNKLSHLLRRQRFDQTLDEEVHLHLEARAADLMAEGMPESEALAQARREFGPVVRIAEQSREAWRWTWLEDLFRDLAYAGRSLTRERGFAATAVLSLALGIGVNTTIFSLTAEFLFSRPSVRDPDSLVMAEIGGASEAPMREYRFIRDAGVFDGLAGANEMHEANWRTGESSLRVFTSQVTDNFFAVTGTPVALGRPIQTGERDVAVVTHKFWQFRLHGDPDILGRTLVIDGRPHTVVGVLPSVHRTLTGFGYSPDVYVPVPNENARVALYGRLPSGMTPRATLERLRAACVELDRVYPDGNHKWALEVSVTGLAGVSRLTQGFLAPITLFFAMLMGVVALLLLIACANVASLLLARAAARAQEFAVRMSIGAGRGRLIRQILAESLLLSLLGTLAGLALNYTITRWLNGASLPLPFPIRLSIEPDSRLLLYASLIAIASAVLAGLLPALRSTRSGVSPLLKRDEHQVSGRRASLRNLLVAGQLAVSVVLLITAALSVRNLMRSAHLDPGFDITNTVWAQLRLVPESSPDAASTRAAVLPTLERLRALPGVAAATSAMFVPLNDHFASRAQTVYTDAAPQGVEIQHSWNAVAPDYFKTMRIDLLGGREFTTLDRQGAQPVVIVNETFARLAFGAGNPVGRHIRLGRDDRVVRVVAGLVRNSKYSTIGEADRPALYESRLQVGGRRPTLHFLLRTQGSPEALLKPLNGALLAAHPAAAVEVIPMSRATGFALLPSRAGAALLGTIGALGLLLASVGLYGVLAYSISRRTREIGLRVAVGAQPRDVLRLVFGETAWILSLGLGLGVLVGLLVTRPFTMFLVPGLKPTDPLTYMVVAGVLFAVGCAASLTPALRALRIDPGTALRYE